MAPLSATHRRAALVWAIPAWAALVCAVPAWAADPGQGDSGFTELHVPGPFRTLDGDTFEGDLNGDGRLDVPEERVRLLYVDTPEVMESAKGMDRARGEAARDFLARWLERGAVTLLVPRDRPRETYGRTLAILRAGEEEANLLLVLHGHSALDTRYNFPANYGAYAEAEAQAFEQELGIWSDARSREGYLRRLEREWRTPRTARNPRYGGSFGADAFEWKPVLGKYVRVTGRLITVDGTQPRSVRVALDRGAGREPVRGVLFHPMTERLRMTRWPPGVSVVLEGFVRGYQNRPHIVIHYAAMLPVVAGAQGQLKAQPATR